jgi:hypothetical protein
VLNDFRGLDLTSPYDQIKNGRTPFAKNFRLYAEASDSRRVAISTRKGAGTYIPPYTETANISNTSTAGQAAAPIGVVLNWRAMHFTPSSAGRLTKLELNLRRGTGVGPLTVSIHADDAGKPGTLIAETAIASSLIGDAYSYVPARFIEAPLLTGSTKYWAVAHIQDDGSGQYEWASNTTTSTSLVSNSSISGFGATTVALNYKTYLAPDYSDKGTFRFNTQSGINKTIVVYGTTIYSANDGTGALTSIATGLSASATEYSFATADGKVFWVNGYDQLKAWDGTTVETITDADLPILSQICMHKDRLWGVVAADKSKLVFSENPGVPAFLSDNVTPTPANQQWYYAWLSVSFIYIPAPKRGDYITSIISFQDSLTVFTTAGKWVVSGSDRGSFNQRQSTGFKGAVSAGGTFVDENFIYFVAQDGFYRYNGSSDELISDMTAQGGGSIQAEFDRIGDLTKVTIAKWKRQIRFYYGRDTSYNTDCLLFHTVYEEWQHDTEVYVKRATYWSDADDDQRLVETSSLVPAIYNAEQDFNALGKAIDFAYWLKYDSMGGPAQRKRLLKYFPLVQGVGQPFVIDVDMDTDFANRPVKNQIILTEQGAVWSAFDWGDGTKWGGDTSFKPQKLRFPGYGYYHQMRISRKAANNPVNFFGVQYSYKAKRL